MIPAGPGPFFDVFDVLNGTVDMRTYQRRYLVIRAAPQNISKVTPNHAKQGRYDGDLGALVTCIEWLEQNFGWTLVNIFARTVEGRSAYEAVLSRPMTSESAGV
ncbi:MAG: hypothetical protein JWN03_1965 [Nocardia sp.]|nr:hypothetical protein [Nocardia sp.]